MLESAIEEVESRASSYFAEKQLLDDSLSPFRPFVPIADRREVFLLLPTYYLQLTAGGPLTTYYLVLTTYCLLLTAYYSPLTAYCFYCLLLTIPLTTRSKWYSK